jgi:hypothetical protein
MKKVDCGFNMDSIAFKYNLPQERDNDFVCAVMSVISRGYHPTEVVLSLNLLDGKSKSALLTERNYILYELKASAAFSSSLDRLSGIPKFDRS